MKLQTQCPFFTLNMEPLWNQKNGPKISDINSERLNAAHHALKKRFRTDVGFYDLPANISDAEIQPMKELSERLRDSFEGALLIGIGGSFLGPFALQQALRTPKDEESFPIHWLSNTDGYAIERAEHFCRRYHPATVIISKSGNTTETLSAFFHLSARLDPKGFVVVTDPERGELRRLAREQNWASLEVPPSIGGRFSVLSPVGLFPLLLSGLPAEAILTAAREMRGYLESMPIDDNPAYTLALALYLWDKKFDHSVQYLMPYESNLKQIADWYVQLYGESLGKRLRTNASVTTGPTPAAALGTSDQHSLLQLFKEGPANKVIGFLESDTDAKNTTVAKPSFSTPDFDYFFSRTFEEISHLASRATQQSLNNSSVPTYRFTLQAPAPQALGALLFFLETSCAFSGELYEVEAFNQPGVEETKRLLRESLVAR